jgi:N-acetylmuramoyl-L-alanine amidase
MTLTTTTLLTENCYHPRNGKIWLIGIHTMEAPEAGDTAENVARYFTRPEVQASAHWCVDNNSRVRCVLDSDGAWTMPPTNHESLNIEMAGYAGQTTIQWADAYSLAVLDNAAVCAAEWVEKYKIPVRRLSPAQIANREPGFAGHADVNRVFHASDHSDPGVNFPWLGFLARVSAKLGNPIPVPPMPPAKADCSALQRAVHATPDNLWGNDTDKHCEALIDASNWGGGTFPYGVAFTQLVVGVTQDGIWGPASGAAHTKTVMYVQNDLRAMGYNPGTTDGFWGPNTDRAYKAARADLHI